VEPPKPIRAPSGFAFLGPAVAHDQPFTSIVVPVFSYFQ
jgi:hypothetical protein